MYFCVFLGILIKYTAPLPGFCEQVDIYPKNEENISMGDMKKQAKHSKIRGYLHDFGKLFIDIAKLAFGSLVLGTIIRWDIPHTTTFILGIILARTNEEK